VVLGDGIEVSENESLRDLLFAMIRELVHRPINKCSFDWAILDAERLGFAACVPVGSVRGEPERLCAKRAQPLCIQESLGKCTLIYRTVR